MAHFARVENGIVREVITVANAAAPDEATGQAMLTESGFPGTWLQTSYNTHGNAHNAGGTPFRKNYAGVGFTYDATLDAFIPPKPSPTSVLDTTTGLWT